MNDHVEALRGVVDDKVTALNRAIAEHVQELAVCRRFIIATVASEPGRITIHEDGHWLMGEEVWVRMHQDGAIQTFSPQNCGSASFAQFYSVRHLVHYPSKTAEVEELMQCMLKLYIKELAVKADIAELKELGEHILRG